MKIVPKMVKLLACRACLATDVNLFILKHKMRLEYEKLTGTKVAPDDGMPQHLCVICRKQLMKAMLFQQSCGEAQVLLENTLQNGMITTDVLREIVKEKYKLQRNYQITPTFVLDILDEVQIKEASSDEEPLSKKVKRSKRRKTKTEVLNETEIKNEFSYKTDDENDQYSLEDTFDALDDIDEIFVKNEEESVVKKEIECEEEDMNLEVFFLSKEQQLEEIASRKLSDNYLNSFYKCCKCYQGFISEASFTKHMTKHDPRRGDFPCDICHVYFSNEATLRSHARSFHERRYICKICSHTSKTIFKAKEHHRWHNGFTYDCKICGAKFSKSTTRLTHIRLRHPSQYSCELCGEAFIGEYGLRMHKVKSHTQEELSVEDKCDVCGVTFQNSDALQRHSTVTHHDICDTNVRPCVHCGENFTDDISLRQHIKDLHTSKEIYVCDECDARFVRAGALSAHRRRRHRKPAAPPTRAYMCEACGLSCNSGATLKSHQRTHTGEKPFHCPKCPKQFNMLQNLRIHVRTHTGERPFQCASCPKAFRHKAALNRHVRVHTGVKPYPCPHCDKCFSQSNSMKSHVRTVHLKLPSLYRHNNKPIL